MVGTLLFVGSKGANPSTLFEALDVRLLSMTLPIDGPAATSREAGTCEASTPHYFAKKSYLGPGN